MSLIPKARHLPLLPHCTYRLIACYPLAPISVLFGENCVKKKTKINFFDRFLPPSFVLLFHPRLPTLKKILSSFISISYSLNLSVNEIEFPFTNSILVKNGMRQAILLLFTLVKGFEKTSLWYRFMTSSNHMD